jgi:WD40 repeat protein/tRNA A-37 threonylcarbamoyl transferase component Bud32
MRWDDPATSYDGGDESRPSFEAGPTIGRGGEGVVTSGRDRRLPRDVAWKTAHRQDRAGQSRLRQEARVLAMLEHPSIVPVYDLVDDHGELRMATRHVRGETLHTFIHGHQGASLGTSNTSADVPQSPDHIARGLRHILAAAEALAFAHSRGVVHRDVKPANIMVGSFGETQLIDWGFAVVQGDPVQLGVVVGTACNMSPEQARGEHPDPSIDVWGLGTTLFELVARRPLYTEPHAPPILERLVFGDRPPLHVPGLPNELHAILERALSPHLECRYPNARAFADDLSAYIDGRVVSAYAYRGRDRLLRFIRAHRVAVGIGIAVFVTLVIGLPVAFDRIGAERDAAIAAREDRTAALIRAETTVAQREHAIGQRPEAELAAANVLELSESPEARGIIAAFGRAPRLHHLRTLDSDALGDGCRDLAVSSDGRHVLCGRRPGLVVYGMSDNARGGGPMALTPVLVEHTSYRSATITDDGLWVSHHAAGGLTFTPFRGRGRRVFEGCSSELRAAGNLVLDVSPGCAAVLSTERAHRIPLSPGDVPQSVASDGESHFALLNDGTLLASRLPHVTRVQTELRSSTREYISAALLPFDGAHPRVAFGTTRGTVIVLDATTGNILANASLGPDRMVRELAVDAAHNRILARVDAGGVLLLDATSLAIFARLPRSSSAWAQFLGDGTLVSFGSALSFWHIPTGPVAGFDGLTGVTSLTLTDDRLLVTHGSSVTFLDATSGATLASLMPSNPDGFVAKSAAIRGPDIVVAIASPTDLRSATGPSPIDSPVDSPELRFEAWRGLRRLAPLSDGRLTRATTRNGLHVEYPDGAWTLLDPWRQIDLAVRGDLLVHLTATPPLLSVWDLSGPPLRLTSCPDDGSSAVGLVDDPDGPIVLSAQSRWVVATRDCSIIKIFSVPAEPSRVVGLGPTETGLVAAGTRDGEVLVWDWSGTLRARVLAHLEPVSALTLDPSGRWLASGAWDGRVRLLDLALVTAPRAKLVETLRSAWLR